mmetsp:Transcript_1408/g.2951  ORF Transcript_1408/g.2951 Transcript_1408/m.2951 type:complete len:377 (+) Transcript_1408:180-1310(+)
MYYSKKKRAEMRKRRKKKEQHQRDTANDRGDDNNSYSGIATCDNKTPTNISGASKKRKRDDSTAERNTVHIPAGLSGKEVRKFRKDARRKVRAEGKDESSVRFVDASGKEMKIRETKAHSKNKDEGEGQGAGDDRDDGSQPPEKKRKRKAKSFPRINDLIAAHEAEQKKQKEVETRKPVPEDEQQRYVALDCEMVGIGAGGKQSALARVSMTGWNHEVLLDTFVQVPDRVTDFRTHVSGVRAADIKAKNDDAMELHACRRKVGEMLRGKILVGHALKNDFSALMLDHPRSDIRDTARYRPFMRPSGRGGGKMRPRKLRDLVKQHLGLDIQVAGEAHCSIDDAQATMKLFQFAKDEWDKEIASKQKGGAGGKVRRTK